MGKFTDIMGEFTDIRGEFRNMREEFTYTRGNSQILGRISQIYAGSS